jgi:hypothetical protein
LKLCTILGSLVVYPELAPKFRFNIAQVKMNVFVVGKNGFFYVNSSSNKISACLEIYSHEEINKTSLASLKLNIFYGYVKNAQLLLKVPITLKLKYPPS